MRYVLRLLTALLSVLACAAPSAAQQYPSRVVTIIVPYPAGGPTDQLARVLAPALSDKLGQNFIVENVSGGATAIASGRVARAAPDGYTLLLHNLQISANVSLYHNLPFDTEKDLTPVIFINNNPLVLIGRKTLEPNTLFHRYPPPLPDDDTAADMEEMIDAVLSRAGYFHYETSAYAQPEHECRHNLNYWRFGDYLGIGAGAHSKLSFADAILR